MAGQSENRGQTAPDCRSACRVTADIEAQVYWRLGALDWDRVTTKPSKAKLLSLGLDDVAKDLYP